MAFITIKNTPQTATEFAKVAGVELDWPMLLEEHLGDKDWILHVPINAYQQITLHYDDLVRYAETFRPNY